jgi:protein O-mannosyl-transferase
MKKTKRNPTTPPAAPASAATATTSATTPTWQVALLAVALVAATWWVYRSAPTHSFVSWDDPTYVTENPLFVQQGKAVSTNLWRQTTSNNYHPLTMWSLRQNVSANGVQAGPIIRTNVWLHCANSVLVLLLFGFLSRGRWWVAFGTALVWAVHPMHVESVTWVSERKDVLYVFFGLGALLAWLFAARRQSVALGALALGLVVLSCLSKAMAVVLPLLMLLIDYWEGRPMRQARVWLEKVPFLAVSLLFGLIALDVQRGGNFHGWFEVPMYQDALSKISVGTGEKIQYAGYALLQYVVKLIVPTGLCTYYPYPSEGGNMGPLFALGLPFFLAYVGVLAWAFWTGRRVLAFGLAWLLISVATVLQFVAVGSVIMADRYTYLAHIGLIFSGLYFFSEMSDRRSTLRWPLVAVVGVWAAACLALAPAQVATWRNTIDLWSHAIALHPECGSLYAKRGQSYGKEMKDTAKAKADLEKAIELNPASAFAYEGLGIVAGIEGNPAQAEAMFSKAIAIKSQEYNYYYNRAIARMQLKQHEGCIADLEQYRKLYPAGYANMVEPYLNALYDSGRYEQTKTAADEAIRLQVKVPRATLLRAYAQKALGNAAAARADAEAVLRLEPNNELAKALLAGK